MNRRTFMRLLAGAAVAPAIGLPTPAEAAPTLKLWPTQELNCSGYVPVGSPIKWVRYYTTYSYSKSELEGKIKEAMDKMVFKPPFSGPQTLTITIPAGTAMCYADDDRVVKSAWGVSDCPAEKSNRKSDEQKNLK